MAWPAFFILLLLTIIHLSTEINAPLEICFDLARSVDAHLQSMQKTKEIAIAGRTSGLCELSDTIIWEANHFGIRQRLTVEISKMDRPRMFEDRMVQGAFKSMLHEHWFEFNDGNTLMKDKFVYETPLGILGILFDKVVLKSYMTSLLLKRNSTLKLLAENK